MSAIIAPRFKWMQRLARESYSPSTDVPNLVNWYRADTVTIGAGVSQLTDKKGTVNLTQATGSKQPTFNASDSLMGGRDSITSDGVDDGLFAVSPGIGSMGAITIYLVIRSAIAPASSNYMLAIGNASVAQSVSISEDASSRIEAAYYNPGSTGSSWRMSLAQHAAGRSAPTILSFSLTPTTGGAGVFGEGRARLASQGAKQVTGSTGASLASQSIGLFANTNAGGSFAAFTFAELMICNAAHTADQMRRVELYLAGYYGVT